MKLRSILTLAALAASILTFASPAGAATRTQGGYWMLAADGHVYGFGGAAADLGSPWAIDGHVRITPTPTGNGYWVLHRSGVIDTFGDAADLGNGPTMPYPERYTTMAATPSGAGYWLFTDKGRALRFGDATFYGDMSGTILNGPVLDAIATPTGNGYYMVGSDGGVFTFGDAAFRGSTGNIKLNKPVMSLAPDADGAGYWLVASDGGIFAFAAPFFGSTGNIKLNKPISGIVASPTGGGYLMVASDGGVFAFGDVPFHGSLGANPPAYPVVSIAAIGNPPPAPPPTPPPPAPVYEWVQVLPAYATTGAAQTVTFDLQGDQAVVTYGCWDDGTYSYGCSYTLRNATTGAYADGWMTDPIASPSSQTIWESPGLYLIEGDEYGDATSWGVAVADHRCVQNCD